MSDEYKKLITERIREEVNRWIEELKEQHKDLLLTKQWRILFPKGFLPGHNSISVVTHSKNGQHLVAEIEFVLPDDLNLDVNDLQLVLKDEGFQEPTNPASQKKPNLVPVDEPLDMLNRIVIGINEFIAGIGVRPTGTATSRPIFLANTSTASSCSAPVRIVGSDNADLEGIKRNMINSAQLPEWIRNIESKATYDEVLNKLASAFQQYQRQSMGRADLSEFFSHYTAHMLNAGHLHYHCNYKGKPVELNERGYCQESYCSKKPFSDKCNVPKLRFGGMPDKL